MARVSNSALIASYSIFPGVFFVFGTFLAGPAYHYWFSYLDELPAAVYRLKQLKTRSMDADWIELNTRHRSPACLPACLPACPPACLSVCLHWPSVIHWMDCPSCDCHHSFLPSYRSLWIKIKISAVFCIPFAISQLVFCCTVLHYTTLLCTTPTAPLHSTRWSVIIFYFMLQFISLLRIWRATVCSFTIPSYIVLYWVILYCIALYFTVLYYTVLQYNFYDMILFLPCQSIHTL